MDWYPVFVIGWGVVCVVAIPVVILIIVDAFRSKKAEVL
jgi:hypothetical protein